MTDAVQELCDAGTTGDPQTFSVDFDDTFTRDPLLWRAFAELAKERGHTVICASLRMNTMSHTRQLNEAWDNKVEVVLCSHNYKDEVCRRRGHRVDVWIDDMPFACKEEKMASFVSPVPMQRVIVHATDIDGDDCTSVLLMPEEVNIKDCRSHWLAYRADGGVKTFIQWLHEWVPGVEDLEIHSELEAKA